MNDQADKRPTPQADAAKPHVAPGGAGQLSAERLSDIIGAIYDCVLTPANWAAALEGVNRAFTFASCALGVTPLRAGAQVINVTVGVDDAWLSERDSYTADAVAMWGGPERLQRFPLGEPIVASQSPGYAEIRTNRYFREILEPRGLFDAVAIAVASEPLLLGYVAFNRHRSAGDIRENEIDGLRVLAPHFRRAVTISNLFDMKAIEAKTFSSALDAMSVGVVLVDEWLDIVHANVAAEAMLAAADPIHSLKGTLMLPTKAATDALQAAVTQAARDEGALGQRGIGIPARRITGGPCVVHVMPLRHGDVRRNLVPRATAALFVAPAETGPQLPTDALALLYDLTPAERRVFELVCAAKTLPEIADELGIAASTVKTHLLHVFEKTGCTRQVELLKLAAELSAPV